MKPKLESEILSLFYKAIGVTDTIWYSKTETLYDAIIRTIESYETKNGINKPPADCTNMVLYGDGNKFLTPVWYSCGRCNPCPRDTEAKHND